MAAVLSIPVFVAFALVAVAALVRLRKTRLFWLPGTAFMAYGVAIYVAWPWYETGSEVVSVFSALSNFLHVAVSVVVVTAGFVGVIVAGHRRQRARRAAVRDITASPRRAVVPAPP